MQIEKRSWHSPTLGGDMPIGVYGHHGTPLLFFPTADADFEELERFQMIHHLAHHIEAGRIKVYTINVINGKSWFARDLHPAERARRQTLYASYVVNEVVPFIYESCRTWGLPIATAGASMGAYHASNTMFRNPEIFRWCICMSGIYDISLYFDGYYDDNCYYHNPADYMARMDDPRLLAELSSSSINILCGQGPWERVGWSRQIHEVLSSRGIHHNFDLWGAEVSHDWAWWFKQMDVYVERLF